MAGDAIFNSMYEAIKELRTERFGYQETEIVIQTWTDGDWAKESGTLVLQEIYKSPVK